MTALSQYERLECPGLWRETSDSQRRDVIVSFGDASLVISDANGTALTHWSLAAVERKNPGEHPALFGPEQSAEEVLEIEDETMVDSIGKVLAALERARPHRGRLRLVLLAAALALVVGLMLFWMPGALRRHTVSAVPSPIRTEIGARLLDRISRVSGVPCSSEAGKLALERLGRRLLGPKAPSPVVLPGGIASAAHLPGGIILLNRSIVEDHEDAAITAGFILAERARAIEADPLDALLRWGGPIASFRLLTTGTLPDELLAEYAETLVTEPPAPIADEILLAFFDAAELPSTPYAYALDVSGETVLTLIEADPMRGKVAQPLLSDSDWIQLQGICGE